MQKKSFTNPDAVSTFPKTKIETVTMGENTFIRNTFEPGWKWSVDRKPTAGTNLCQAHHVLCMISGHLRTVMDDGTAMDMGPGDVADIPPGHDAWVVGDEAVVAIDVGGVVYNME